jgi:glycine hydroxymethyltransferase
VTSRGMNEADMDTIAGLIDRALLARDDDTALAQVRADVERLTAGFPLHRGVEEPVAAR